MQLYRDILNHQYNLIFFLFFFFFLFIYFFFFFAQNIDCGYTLEPPPPREAVLMSNHSLLCFGAKIRKIGIPLRTPVLVYKSGVEGGI